MKNSSQSKTSSPLLSKLRTKPYAITIGAIALAIVVGGTAFASNGAKPGDVLYSVDTATEKVQSLFTFSPVGKADLALALAAERVEETNAVLEAPDFARANLTAGLDGLTAQKQILADLLAEEAELKALIKQYEDAFDAQEVQLDTSFREAEAQLEALKDDLELQLAQAILDGGIEEVNRLRVAIADLEARLDAVDIEKDAAEEALEAEEDRIEALMNAAERALEAEEDAREAEIERLEDEAEAARDRAEAAAEAEKDAMEQQAEAAEEAAESAREAEVERSEQALEDDVEDNERAEQSESFESQNRR